MQPRYTLAKEDIATVVEDVMPHLMVFLEKHNARLLAKYDLQPRKAYLSRPQPSEYLQLVGVLAGHVGWLQRDESGPESERLLLSAFLDGFHAARSATEGKDPAGTP